MSELSPNEENNKSTANQKIFGLPRPLVGAFIGVIFFLLLLSVTWFIKEAKYFVAALLSPGLFATALLSFSSRFDLPSNWYTFLLFSLSCVPYAILGSLIFSKNKSTRINGIIFLIIYFIYSFCLGIFVLGAFSD